MNVRPVEKPGGIVQSNIDVCLVSCPVTRNTKGFPANETCLPSPGMRMTAFALMISSVGLRFIAPSDGLTCMPLRRQRS